MKKKKKKENISFEDNKIIFHAQQCNLVGARKGIFQKAFVPFPSFEDHPLCDGDCDHTTSLLQKKTKKRTMLQFNLELIYICPERLTGRWYAGLLCLILSLNISFCHHHPSFSAAL